MEQVTIHLTGSAEEVAEALRVLAGPLLPSITAPAVIPVDMVAREPPESIATPRKGPYSDTICAREGCFNKLSRKQVTQRTKYCSMSCAGQARRGRERRAADDLHATIVAGEGVVSGSVMSEESASKLPAPS